MNQPKENVIGATVEACAKVAECAKKVSSQAKVTAHGWAYKALTGICDSKWLLKAEGAIVGALNSVNEAPKVEPKEVEEENAVTESVVEVV